MKNWRILIFSVVLIAITTSTAFAKPQIYDKIIAIVNNDIVLKSDIDSILYILKLQAKQFNKKLPDDKTLRHEILEQKIMNSIILQIGKQQGLRITPQQVDQACQYFAEQNNISFEDLRDYLNNYGISYKKYRQQIHDELLILETRNQAVKSRINILPETIDDLAKKIASEHSPDARLNFSQIMINLSHKLTQKQIDNKITLAKQVIKQLKYGAEINKIVTKFTSKSKFIQIVDNAKWSTIKNLPIIFFPELKSSKKGDIIGPIRSNVGLHIFKIHDIVDEKQPLSVIEVKIRHILLHTSPILNDEQAQVKLEMILSDIKNNKITFTEAVQKFTDDQYSASQGGNLGWLPLDVYETPHKDAILKMKKGEISRPIPSSIGWHLIQLLDIRKVVKTEQIQKGKAYELLFKKKFEEEARKWFQEQRDSSYVQILDH